ncbi:MAG: hypothetical protein ACE15B_09960 [Bryobacteraceae bacterium]
MRLNALMLLAVMAFAAGPPRLVEWERGIALEPRDDPGMTMYLWFYEWNMFEAMAPGPHTHGTYKLDRRIDPRTNEARITSPAIDFRMKPAPDGAEMSLTVKNVTGYDWPEIAAIIPCWSPGQVAGTNPNSPLPKTVAFADPEHDKTEFLSTKGLALLTSRAIHFNQDLRAAADKVSDHGTHAFSYKWPTSDENARAGILVRKSADGKWVTGIAWQDYLSVQGHNPWSCMHVAVKVGPLKVNASKTVRGRLCLFRGTTEQCWRRLSFR